MKKCVSQKQKVSIPSFIQAYPTNSTTAHSALYPFSQWIANFGAPSELTTDDGTQFANELISQFCDLAAIDFDTIHAYLSTLTC